jgi:hypothetical protein
MTALRIRHIGTTCSRLGRLSVAAASGVRDITPTLHLGDGRSYGFFVEMAGRVHTADRARSSSPRFHLGPHFCFPFGDHPMALVEVRVDHPEHPAHVIHLGE